MPIVCPFQLPCLTAEAFGRLDYEVMRLAFETQRSLGRSCDESIYQKDLADRLEAAGLGPTHLEATIQVRHGSFVKDYHLDLVVAEQVVYELKAVRALGREHESQLLNYLLLADSPHGKLVNFRGPSVESRFVNNALSRSERYRHEVCECSWKGSQVLKRRLLDLIEDMGLFLEVALYNQAILQALGGDEMAVQRVDLASDGRILGSQAFQMCETDQAFRVTALHQQKKAQRVSLQKLLNLTSLRALHWINLDRHQVELTTLTRI